MLNIKLTLKSSYIEERQRIDNEREKLIAELAKMSPHHRGSSMQLRNLRKDLSNEQKNVCFGPLCNGNIHTVESFTKNSNLCKKCHRYRDIQYINKNNGRSDQRTRYLLRQGKSCEICGCSEPIMLEFDHLNPKEKNNGISRLSTTKILEEIKKVRILCIFCHRLHSKAQRGIIKITPKRQYVNEIKLSIGKCQSCNRLITPETTCCFDFDHINPDNKIMEVSQMVSKSYSYQKINDEIKKCQMLCCYCHRRKTTKQLNHAEHHKIKIKLKEKKIENLCVNCGEKIYERAFRCLKCQAYNQRKVKERPSLEEINKDLKELGSYVQVGKKYNVSDNAIRKWIKAYEK